MIILDLGNGGVHYWRSTMVAFSFYLNMKPLNVTEATGSNTKAKGV